MTERENCFYCGDPVFPSRVERDHFPIPASAGGAATVVACPQCHDLKDRTNWRDLPSEMMAAFLEDFQRMSRAGRIVVAQLLRSAYELKTPPGRELRLRIEAGELGDIADLIGTEDDLAVYVARHAMPLLRDGFPVTVKPNSP